PGQKLVLSWVDPYYPLLYQDENTKKLKGSSIAFFDFVHDYLRDVSFEYVHYDAYREFNNTSMRDWGGAIGSIADGRVLTELSGVGSNETYLHVFSLSPSAGTDALTFYEAAIETDKWSPLSFFIPFTPLISSLSVVSIVVYALLQYLKRTETSRFAEILTAVR
ncbi:hypothetical protein PENTCL1PPCAC_21666, partial [Pristionchus entomophagus]